MAVVRVVRISGGVATRRYYQLVLTGLIRVHVARFVDVGVRHDAAFCKITA